VNLAVLRLAFCELSLFSDIPAGATINEAVELVKTFGSEEDAAYVNGILGTYERSRNKT
jgi:N utilization substance protein B